MENTSINAAEYGQEKAVCQLFLSVLLFTGTQSNALFSFGLRI